MNQMLPEDIISALLADVDMRAIAAATKDRVIGNNGMIPWNIREEMDFFRRTTSGGTVLMGRKTFESIGHPLPNRRNIVFTANTGYTHSGIEVIHSADQLLSMKFSGEVWVCGGASIYEKLLPACRELYLSEIFGNFPGDVFFPKFDDLFEFERTIVNNALFRTSMYKNKLMKYSPR